MFRTTTIALAIFAAISSSFSSAAVHDAGLFTTNTLARNDDGSTGQVALGFDLNFFGQTFSNLYVNNNGNVTFDNSLSTYTPFNLITTNRAMLAPFFADVDTRNELSGVVQYGQATLDGRNVFGVNWLNVGYYASQADKTNSFQLIITDRSDTGAGNFDFQYNYDNISWETGSASAGVNGFGGDSARAGWSNGVDHSYEFTGSAVDGSLLNSGANALTQHSLNSNTVGQYNFEVRNGVIIPPTIPAVPEPETYAMLFAGLGLTALVARRRKMAI